jgi:hypothetical protein
MRLVLLHMQALRLARAVGITLSSPIPDCHQDAVGSFEPSYKNTTKKVLYAHV